MKNATAHAPALGQPEAAFTVNPAVICSAAPGYTVADDAADELDICGAFNRAVESGACRIEAESFRKPTEHTVPARRLVWHPKDWSEYVPVICSGWAASSIALSNGSRQILSFLLPGDIVSTATLFGAVSNRTVEAITEVTFRKFRRADVRALLHCDPGFFDRVSKAWVQEREQADNLLVDLGRRMADARIARLLLYLFEAATRRSMTTGQTMPFPLRQRHIADATGLTPNHVTKTLHSFQRSDLIDISDRLLTIIDENELRHIASWNSKLA